MQPVISHSWNLTTSDAFQLQESLAAKVIKEDCFDELNYIAGVDVAYEKQGDKLCAAVVVLESKSLEVVETTTAIDVARFPYVSGLFSFRELPPICQALAKLKIVPDLIVCDAQGIAHPRRFGLACHLGVLFDIPTIGCGKTRLVGEASIPGANRDDFSPLCDNGEIIGRVLRTQDGIKPLYVSIGHRVSLSTACDWVLRLCPKYRLPQTTRFADQLVRQCLR